MPGNGNPLHLAAQFGAIPLLAARRGLDVLHGPAYLVPPVSPVPTVATMLDVIWIHHPETMDLRARIGFRTLAPLCARSADRVLAISAAARNDIVRTIGLDPGKIDISPLGIRSEPPPALAEAETREAVGLGDEPFVLTVAQIRPHKNLDGLVRALAQIGDRRVRLVVPGSRTEHAAELQRLAASLGVEERVLFPGWVDGPTLEGLYAACGCFALATFEEGFGLPLLEAMRRGAPVACSNVSALPEVAGDAAVYFDPRDVGQIASSIQRLLTDRAAARDLVERGHERCRAMTWERTARATLASYRRAIEQRERGSRVRRLRARVRSSPGSPPRSPSR
jgi:alpha-1,3-rhamnosyl/mannosyltransferase